MSDKPDIEAIEARLAASVRGTWTFDSHTGSIREGNRWCPVANWVQEKEDAEFIAHAPADIAALLAEVKRLQRERSEWCDQADRRLTEQMTQQRDLLAEVERLREALTLTPEKVEAAAKANYEADHPGCSWDAWDNSGWGQTLYRDSQRAALLAAGMTEEALQ